MDQRHSFWSVSEGWLQLECTSVTILMMLSFPVKVDPALLWLQGKQAVVVWVKT